MIIISRSKTIALAAGTEKPKNSPYLIASVDRALELLFILEKNPRDMGVTELSHLLDIQKSSTHNLLQTLLAKGFVQQTDTGRYTLGLQLMRLGAVCAERLDVRRIARPFLEELAEETGEIALFGLRVGNEITIVDKAEPPSSFFMIPKFDFSSTFHCSAIGKVLLAYSPESFVSNVLANGLVRYTPYTIIDSNELKQELIQIRTNGFAVACNETVNGVTCISTPIFDANNRVEGAFSISSSSSLLTKERHAEVLSILKNKSLAVSRALGYHSQPAQ